MKKIKSFAEKLKAQSNKQFETKSNPEVEKLNAAIRSKDYELSKYKKQLAEIEKVKAELEQYKESTTKERVSQAIKAELVKTAKKLNVKDSALDDVIDLLQNKFVYNQEDNKVLPSIPEGAEPVDTEQYISQWLENKNHFIQPPAAQPANVKPSPQGVKTPAQPNVSGNALSSATINAMLGIGSLYKK
jgi:hypothetical protein